MMAMVYNNDQHIFNVADRFQSASDHDGIPPPTQPTTIATSAGSWPRSALQDVNLSASQPWQASVSRPANVSRGYNVNPACQCFQIGQEFCSCSITYTTDSASFTSQDQVQPGGTPLVSAGGLSSSAPHEGLLNGMPLSEHVGDASPEASIAFDVSLSQASATEQQHTKESPSMSPPSTHISSSPGWRQQSISWAPSTTILSDSKPQAPAPLASYSDWTGGNVMSSPMSLPTSMVPVSDNVLGLNVANNMIDRRFSVAATHFAPDTQAAPHRSLLSSASLSAQRRVSLPYHIYAKEAFGEDTRGDIGRQQQPNEGMRPSSSLAFAISPASSNHSDQPMVRSNSAQPWQPMRLDLSSLPPVSENAVQLSHGQDSDEAASQVHSNLVHFNAHHPMSVGHAAVQAGGARFSSTLPTRSRSVAGISAWGTEGMHLDGRGWDNVPNVLYPRGVPGLLDEDDSSVSNTPTGVVTPTQGSNRFTVSLPNAGLDTGLVRSSFRDLTTEEGRWAAMLARSHAADQVFLYGAQTTKIVCKPSCASKRPDRNRVRFFFHPGAAEAALREGYRPCKRCKPHLPGSSDQCVGAVGACVRHITRSAFAGAGDSDLKRRTLKEYAAMARLSPFHFHRTFKAVSSVTPGEYAKACHTLALQDSLGIDNHGKLGGLDALSIGAALSGWSIRRARRAVGGISPTAYSAGCMDLDMSYTTAWTAFGKVAIAFTDDTLYATLMCPDAEERIQRRFPNATRRDDRSSWLSALVEELAAASDREVQLPVDVHYSVRRARIWIAVTRCLVGGSASEEEE